MSEQFLTTRQLLFFRLIFSVATILLVVWAQTILSAEFAFDAIIAVVSSPIVYALLGLVLIKQKWCQTALGLNILNAVLISCDVLVISFLVPLTKGVDSDIYFLYLLPILVASYTLGRRGIIATAFGVALAYLIVLMIGNYKVWSYQFAGGGNSGLTMAYAHKLWVRVWVRSAILSSVAFIWALFCDHMQHIIRANAFRLSQQLAENESLMLEVKRNSARDKLVDSLSLSILSTLELDQSLATAAKTLGQLVDACRCLIIARQSDISSKELRVWQYSKELDSLSISLESAKGLFEQGTNSRGEGSHFHTFICKKSKASDDATLNALLMQEIWFGADKIAVVVLSCHDENRIWNKKERLLVQDVSRQLAIAFEHSRLLEELSMNNAQLIEQNQDLDRKNNELGLVQSQLVHQEKMASLGRMVAGIAHEINNPLNFVQGNVPYLRKYVASLLNMLQELELKYKRLIELYPDAKEEMSELEKKWSYGKYEKEIAGTIDDIAMGIERIMQIISNLRSFSRLDEAEQKEAVIQDGLISTLKLLSQYYGPDRIPVETDLENLPALLCYPGQLNQVWMNLLSNAAEALQDTKEPRVKVSLERLGDFALVTIADNGPGITTENQGKIFEPFFTTKAVGKGTGLGLSICHSIVQRHGGTISFETASGQGTVFKVKIPFCPVSESPICESMS